MPLKDKLLESLASISDAEIKKIEFHKSNTPIGPIESIISFQKIVRHFNQAWYSYYTGLSPSSLSISCK